MENGDREKSQKMGRGKDKRLFRKKKKVKKTPSWKDDKKSLKSLFKAICSYFA